MWSKLRLSDLKYFFWTTKLHSSKTVYILSFLHTHTHGFVMSRVERGPGGTARLYRIECYDWHPLQNHLQWRWSSFAKERQAAATIRRERGDAELSNITNVHYRLLREKAVPRAYAEIILQHGGRPNIQNPLQPAGRPRGGRPGSVTNSVTNSLPTRARHGLSLLSFSTHTLWGPSLDTANCSIANPLFLHHAFIPQLHLKLASSLGIYTK